MSEPNETMTPATPVLTIEQRSSVDTPQAQQDVLWHELTNAYMTRRILSGRLGGIERSANGSNGVAVVYYKGCRVAIPLTEMVVQLDESERYSAQAQRLERLCTNMMDCEIDFVVRGLDAESHSVVASRRDAMLRKQRTYYLTPAADGQPLVHPGRVVQARVIAVAAKSIRIEVFGVEQTVLARDLSWEWVGNAAELYTVGDVILVRVSSVDVSDPENVKVQAEPRSVTHNTAAEKLKECRVQSRYAGTVTDVRRGIVYIRLHNGVNAIAHSCMDARMPCKNDQVSYVVTHINADQGVAIGIITRIIRQNL